MGLSYLSKKTWHPEKFSNIEQVYNAEQKKDNEARLKDERIRKLKEEKHIEDLKRQQVEAGIIPASTLQRLDWMYSDRNAQQMNQQSAEEYLIGKPIDKIENEAPQVENQNQQINENEAFSRMVEDPMVYIKQMEAQKRDGVYQDSMQIQKIKELVDRIEKSKKDKKKKKKKDKDKEKKEEIEQKEEETPKIVEAKEKSPERKRSRSPPSETRTAVKRDGPTAPIIDDKRRRSPERNRDRSPERRRDHREHRGEYRNERYDRDRRDRDERERERDYYERDRRDRNRRDREEDIRCDREHRDRHNERFDRERQERHDRERYHRSDRHRLRSRSRSRSPEEKRKRSLSPPNSLLGPDMKLFAARKRELEESDALKKARSKDSDKEALRKLTHEEKMALVDQMQQSAQTLDASKKQKLNINEIDCTKLTSEEIAKEQNQNKSAKFLNKVKKESYMEAGLSLDERLSRNKHYRGRIENKDE